VGAEPLECHAVLSPTHAPTFKHSLFDDDAAFLPDVWSAPAAEDDADMHGRLVVCSLRRHDPTGLNRVSSGRLAAREFLRYHQDSRVTSGRRLVFSSNRIVKAKSTQVVWDTAVSTCFAAVAMPVRQ